MNKKDWEKALEMYANKLKLINPTAPTLSRQITSVIMDEAYHIETEMEKELKEILRKERAYKKFMTEGPKKFK